MKKLYYLFALAILSSTSLKLQAQQWQQYSGGTQVISDGTWYDVVDGCPFFPCPQMVRSVNFQNSLRYLGGVNTNRFDFRDARNGAIQGFGSPISVTSDSAWTFTPIGGSSNLYDYYSIEYIHDSLVYVLSQNWVSGDMYFSRVEKDTTYSTSSLQGLHKPTHLSRYYWNYYRLMQFINDSSGFIYLTDTSSMYAYILKTDDGGNTWRPSLIDSLDEFRSLAFTDSLHGVANTSTNVYETTDGGLTWSTLSLPTRPISIINSAEFYNDSVAFLATDSFVFRTVNRGINWTVELQSSSPQNYKIKKVIDDQIIYVLSQAGLLRRSLITNIPESSSFAEQLNIYPNPAQANITLDIPSNLNGVEVNIYDLKGRLVLQSNELDLDISELESATYIVNVTSTKGSYFGKFLKMTSP